MRRAQRGLLAALVLVGVTGTLQAQVVEKKGLTLAGARPGDRAARTCKCESLLLDDLSL